MSPLPNFNAHLYFVLIQSHSSWDAYSSCNPKADHLPQGRYVMFSIKAHMLSGFAAAENSEWL